MYVRIPLLGLATLSMLGISDLVNGDTQTGLFEQETVRAINALQRWYEKSSGLWLTTGWWNGANVLTMLADFNAEDPALNSTIRSIFNNTFTQAPLHKPFVLKETPIESRTNWRQPTDSRQQRIAHDFDNGFLNAYYDDEGWWALAWLKVYDITFETRYLQTAVDIFEDMKGGYDATCGGIWWDKAHNANTAIANELFLAVAAQLAIRAPDKQSYREWAFRQWDWFQTSGMIDKNRHILDGLDLNTCKPQHGIIWTYTHGVILGALLDLDTLQPNRSYIETARSIAQAGITYFSDKDGILHEPCEPDCGADGPTFKGVFMRNLGRLQSVVHDQGFAAFIRRNAASIWIRDRSSDDTLGLVWSGPWSGATAATQAAACEALVAAISLGAAAMPH